MKEKEIKPYQSQQSKKQEVESMFDGISSTYDRLNRILSAGIDKKWRKKLIRLIDQNKVEKALDVATGTGDLCFELEKMGIKKITGFDLSAGMLEVAKEKLKKSGKEGIEFIQGDAENLPFQENQFDLITVAFGVRNFERLEVGLSECNRVLKPNGQMLILEFSQPRKTGFKGLYNFYSGKILPTVGGLISKDKKAYEYLDVSAKNFPDGEKFLMIFKNAGFVNTSEKRLTGGIATIYNGYKVC